MKKLALILIVMALSYNSIAQSKQDSVLTDSTALFSIKDYRLFYNDVVKSLPTSEGLQIIDFWQNLLNEKAAAWNREHMKTKHK